MNRYAPLASLVLLAACAGPGIPTHYDIGVIHRTVGTDSAEAQLWFDRGLALCFGFNHEEAVACFTRAADLDPHCAMAHWGIAYALGPNYNAPEVEPTASENALAALRTAATLLERCTDVERDLIGALQTRFAPAPSERSELDAAYAEAMRAVHRAHPDDADVAALTGEALMQLRPWGLWTPEGEMAPETPEIRALLEPALARWPDHPALCHLYIHAMEAGPEVARALPAARRLETLAPGLGHLVHMPSHVYTWTGLYADVVRVNQAAVAADDAYVEHAGRENFYTLYRLHNLHFVAYGAMFDGRAELALEAGRAVVREVPPGLLAAFPDYLDVFTATPYHVLVRFGRWEEMLAEPEPLGELHAARAVWRYARGVAFAALGRVEEAEAEQAAFQRARAEVPETRLLFQNTVADILAVADHVLAGEIAYRRGEHETAFARLRAAVRLDHALAYDEPWGWMEPAEHALGALLTEQGRYADALTVYRSNLARYPENGWALHGLRECLLGLGLVDEAAAVDERFRVAWERADTDIPGSCFCRTGR